MTNQPHDSQISAWFDNELSAAERADVERRLALSGDARDELAETKDLSGWIAELPKDVLPRDFARQIVDSVTETVVPAATADEPVLLAAERVNATSPMRWTQGVGVLISAAAVLVVAVTLMNGPPATDDRGESSIVATNANSRLSDLSMPMDDALQAEAFEEAEALMAGAAGGKMPAQPMGLDRAENQSLARINPARGVAQGNFKFDVDLNRVVVGQDVDARVQSGGQVAVVRLTVVDRIEGLENLQVLLTGSRIAKDAAEYRVRQSGDTPEAAKPGEGKPPRDDYLVAVYVEASEQQLSAVFDKIRKDTRFQSLQVDRPIAADRLAQATPPPLRMARSVRSNGPKFSAVAQAAPPQPTEAAPEAKKSVEPNKGGESKKSEEPKGRRRAAIDAEKRKSIASFADAKKNVNRESPATVKERLVEEELARVSRQLKIALPRKMLLSKSQPAAPLVNESADQPAADDVADTRDKSRSKPSAEADGAKLAPSRAAKRPLQVLFVLDVAPEQRKKN